MRVFHLLLLLPCLASAAPTPGREPQPASPDDGVEFHRSESETAVFAGGNFWNVQRYFEQLHRKGVISTMTGYTGGKVEHPTFGEVEKGDTGHRLAVQVIFDPSKLPYTRLVEGFLRQVDPFDTGGQFCDQGEAYRAAIFFESERQHQDADKVLRKLERKLGKGTFAVDLLPAKAFYAAEPRHQEFYFGNPISYRLYLMGCKREERLEKVWGKNENGAR